MVSCGCCSRRQKKVDREHDSYKTSDEDEIGGVVTDGSSTTAKTGGGSITTKVHHESDSGQEHEQIDSHEYSSALSSETAHVANTGSEKDQVGFDV